MRMQTWVFVGRISCQNVRFLMHVAACLPVLTFIILQSARSFNKWIVKGPIFVKKRHFLIQERFIKLIYSINTIIKCGIWQPVKLKLSLSFLNWIKNEMIFYRISELMLATLIQRYDKKIISFQERETNWNFTGCQVPHFMIVLIPYINLLNLSWIIKFYNWGICCL